MRRLLWPEGFQEKLARILAVLSSYALISLVFTDGPGPMFHVILDYYENLANTLVGWGRPFITAGLRHLGWHLELYPHWKHIFLLMEIYFCRNAFVSYRAGDQWIGIFELVWGFGVALSAGIAAGAMPLASADTAINFTVAGAPILGVFLYEAIDVAWRATFYRERAARIYRRPTPSWWQYAAGGLRGSLNRTFLGLLLLWGALNVPLVRRWPSPSLALLTALVVVQALNLLRIGVSDVKFIRVSGESWLNAYWRTGSAKVGAAMLGVFLWLGAFLLTNAGLRFYGL